MEKCPLWASLSRPMVRFSTTKKQLMQRAGDYFWKGNMVIAEDFVASEFKPKQVVLNKPIYAGQAVLDLSKVWMFQFHYDVMQKEFGADALRLLMSDTDSLFYQIVAEDLREKLAKLGPRWFDFSGYPRDHPLYSGLNKKKIGMFKDECDGVAVARFVGLRAKVYAFELAAAHGVARGVGGA